MADLDELKEKIRIAEQDNTKVIFRGARLQGANLRGAVLRGADLRGADLRGADLNEAILSDANLERATLSDANLSDANLSGAILQGANLIEANLEGVYLERANLIQANLMEANLMEADLTLANLTQTNLTHANLTQTDLTNSLMILTNLTGAILTGAINVDLRFVIIYSTQNPAPVDSNQVHKYASRIDYKKLNKFLKSITKTELIPLDYPKFIKDKFTEFIANFDESSKGEFIARSEESSKEKLTAGLNEIIEQRLQGLDYTILSKDVRDSIFYALNYVSDQPADFKKIYAGTFIQDCVQAYDGPDGMTCALGGIERILFSLLPACAESATDDCEKIVSIIEANPDKLVNKYILEWYKLHSQDGNKFPIGGYENDRRQNLIEFLNEKLPTMKKEWIESKVEEIADNLGYEDGDFAYGGGRKKRRTKKLLTKRSKRSKRTRRSKRTKRR